MTLFDHCIIVSCHKSHEIWSIIDFGVRWLLLDLDRQRFHSFYHYKFLLCGGCLVHVVYLRLIIVWFLGLVRSLMAHLLNVRGDNVIESLLRNILHSVVMNSGFMV